MSIFDKREIRAEHISPYISYQYEVKPQQEQCFEVRKGYDVQSKKNNGGDFLRIWLKCPLSEALTIRSVEDVRREALAAIENIPRYGHEYDPEHDMNYVVKKDDGIYLVRADVLEALIDTPAPSSDWSEESLGSIDRAKRVVSEYQTALGKAQSKPDQEPVAVRHSFDGYGFQYLDAGSGSDWLTRIPNAKRLYSAQ